MSERQRETERMAESEYRSTYDGNAKRARAFPLSIQGQGRHSHHTGVTATLGRVQHLRTMGGESKPFQTTFLMHVHADSCFKSGQNGSDQHV